MSVGALTLTGVPGEMPQALVDLLGLASGFDSSPATVRLTGDQAASVRKAARVAMVELQSGHADHLLHHLRLRLDFGLTVPPSVQRALGPEAGARIDLDLSLTGVNQPVHVAG